MNDAWLHNPDGDTAADTENALRAKLGQMTRERDTAWQMYLRESTDAASMLTTLRQVAALVDEELANFIGSPMTQPPAESLGGVPVAAPEPKVAGVDARSEPAEDLRRASAPACPTCGGTDRGMMNPPCFDHVDAWHGAVR